MVATYYVGTCSWTDRTLIEEGSFYPPSLKNSAERLSFYAQNFNTVEVDSSFYAFPAERNAHLWVERTPASFLFNIKSFSLFTFHKTPLSALPYFLKEELPENLQKRSHLYSSQVPKQWLKMALDAFLSAISPLQEEDKLGYILFQFPPWIEKSREAMEYLSWMRENIKGTIAVEFRHNSWLSEENRGEVFRFLRKEKLSYTCVDEPQLPWTVPPIVEATTPELITRFHGRNKSAWEKKGAPVEEKFAYLYKEEELNRWKEAVNKKSPDVERIFLMFNNCFRDYAIVNAQQMKLFVGE